MAKQKMYNAIDLLDKVIDFKELTPDSDNWTLDEIKSNPPRLIRLKQIQSLAQAFLKNSKGECIVPDDPGSVVSSILKGDFIKRRRISSYCKAVAFIKQYLGEDDLREIYLDELAYIYPLWTNYKLQINSLLSFNSRFMVCGLTSIKFTYWVTDSISSNLLEKCTDLNKALELILNPKGLTFTENVLIKKYNYPVDDLKEIDLDFT